MAAFYYKYANGNDLFLGNTKYAPPISVDFLDGLIDNESNLAIYTSISIATSETIQYFMSFDDLITFYYFGKGLGTINITGMLFCNCSGSIPGITQFYQLVGANRGKACNVSFGGVTFTGPLTASVTNTVAEPDTMVEFNLTIPMTTHTLA